MNKLLFYIHQKMCITLF